MFRHAKRFVSLITLVAFSFSQLFPTNLLANYALELHQDEILQNRYVVSVKSISRATREKSSDIHLTYNYGKLCASKSAPEELKIRSHMGQSEVTYTHEDLYISFLIDSSGNITLRKLQADHDAEVMFDGLGDILLEKTELRNIKSLALKGTHITNQSLLEVDALSLWARGSRGEQGKITNERKLKVKNNIDVFLGTFENNSEIQGTGRHLKINMHDNTLKTKLIQTAHKLTVVDAHVENRTTIKATQNITFQQSTVTNKDGAELNANEIDLEQSTLSNQSVMKAADLTLKDSTLTNSGKTGSLALLNLVSKNSRFTNQAGATLQSLAIDLLENSVWTNRSVINTSLFSLNGSSFENAGSDASLIVEKNMPHKNGTFTNDGVFINKDGAHLQAVACTNNGTLTLISGHIAFQKLMNEKTGIVKFTENPWLLTDMPAEQEQTAVISSFVNMGITEALDDLTYDLKELPGQITAKKNLFFTPRYQQDYSSKARQILESLDVSGKLKLYLSQFDLVEDLDLPKIHDLILIIASPFHLTKKLSTINTEITAPRINVIGHLKQIGNGQYERFGGSIKSTGRQALHYVDYLGEYDRLESQALWLDGKNSHTTSGVSIGHNLLVVDTPHVSFAQQQASWTTDVVSAIEKKNKRGKKEKATTIATLAHAESLPNNVSGFWYGGMITNHFNPIITEIFPDRLSEGECKGQLLSMRSGLFKAGIGGIALTFIQHDSKANIDAYCEPYQIDSQVYSESGSVVRHVIVPTTFDSDGPVDLESVRISMQGTQIKTQSEDLKVIAQSHMDFPVLKVKQEHVPYLKQGKHGSLYKVIGYHEDGLPACFTSLGKAEIKCASGCVTGMRPTINALEPDVSSQISQLPPQSLYQNEESICVWKAPSKKRRAWASVAGIVAGVVTTYLTGGLASGLAATLIQGATASVSSKVAQATVMHKGNLQDVRKELTSNASIRQLVASSLTSMLTSMLTSGAAVDTSSVGNFLVGMAAHTVNGAITGATSAAIQKEDMGDGALQGAVGSALKIGASIVAEKIGDAATPIKTEKGIAPPSIDRPTQICMHAGLGATKGAAEGLLFSKDPLESALAGFGGAVLAEVSAPLFPFDPELNATAAEILTAAAAAITGQDVEIAYAAAANALRNNMLAHPDAVLNVMDPGRDLQKEKREEFEDKISDPSIVNEMTAEEFVEFGISHKHVYGTPTSEERHIAEMKFRNMYEGLWHYDAHKKLMYGPEYKRWERLSALDLEGLKKERMKELDPHGKFTSRDRQRAEKIIENEHRIYQIKKFSVIDAVVLGIAGVRPGVRPLPKTQNKLETVHPINKSESTTAKLGNNTNRIPSTDETFLVSSNGGVVLKKNSTPTKQLYSSQSSNLNSLDLAESKLTKAANQTNQALDLAKTSTKKTPKRSINSTKPIKEIRNPDAPQNSAAYERYKQELQVENKKSYGGVTEPRVAEKKAFPDRELPRYEIGGEPMPDSPSPHCQLGKRKNSKGAYPQARVFDYDGKPLKDIDFTDHGRPFDHPFPHQHRYKQNKTGGTLERDKRAEILNLDNIIQKK